MNPKSKSSQLKYQKPKSYLTGKLKIKIGNFTGKAFGERPVRSQETCSWHRTVRQQLRKDGSKTQYNGRKAFCEKSS